MKTIAQAQKGDIVRFKGHSLRVEAEPERRGARVLLQGREDRNGCPYVRRWYFAAFEVNIERETEPITAEPTFDWLVAQPTLKEAHALVGGFVEMLTLPGGAQMLFDENGRAKGLPINAPASLLAGQPIVGDVIVLQGSARWI